jgi:Na+-transporting NADH:ubiquinone oxidoreductase subunit C
VRDQLKVIGFATLVCLVCSVLLAVVSIGLAPRQARNKANDVKSKVLQVFGESVTDAKGRICVTPDELAAMYSERITGIVLDAQGEKVDSRTVDSLTAQEINVRDKASRLKTFYPLYIYTAPGSDTKQVAIHVSGKGLWSTIKGFMALDGDYSTITGIVFYEHQETPGLGGEVEKPFFQDLFEGKKWIANGEVQPFRITKPGAPITDHSVDGITAATMTCIGVERFLNADYAVYHRYFEQMKAHN